MKQVGVAPVAREKLIMERMFGLAVSEDSFRREVGTMSIFMRRSNEMG